MNEIIKDDLIETPANEQINTKKQKKQSTWKKDLFFFILLLIFVVLPIRVWVAKPFLVNGESMLPTFNNGDYLIVDQISYNLGTPKRGDIVIFRFPQDTSKFFIKRIIGLPNETVILENNDVFIKIDDEITKIEEDYITLQKTTNLEMKLESDEFFVLGDNRLQSLDSRYWGALKEEFIVGRAYLRLFPINVVDLLPGKTNY